MNWMNILAVVARIAASLWIGGAALFTFVLTPTIFRSEGRDAAGRIVGYLFRGYFRWGLICGGILLVALLLHGQRRMLLVPLVAVMLAVTAFQAFSIEPKAAELKRQIPSFETTPKEHPLRREFARLHGISAVCNLSVIAGGIVLLPLLP